MADQIQHLPDSENLSSLQSFQGLTNHYNVLGPNILSLWASLNKLLEKEAKWVRITECRKNFFLNANARHYDLKSLSK